MIFSQLMRKLHAIVPFLMLMLLTAIAASCGDDGGFTIKCHIDGLGNDGLEMVYTTRRGIVRTMFHPKDGDVELKGTSAEPSLVEVFALDGTPLFVCTAADGDRLDLSMKLGDPSSLRIKGQDASRDFAAFVATHDSLLTHGNDSEVNALIASMVRSNPSSLASTLLMVTQFRTPGHEMLADSLLSAIDLKARPASLVGSYASSLGEQVSADARGNLRSFTLRNARDTSARYTPAIHSFTLLVFNSSAKPDSITDRIERLRGDASKRRLHLMEISFAPDSSSWRASVDRDSVRSEKWIQAWAPGGPAGYNMRRMAVPAVPYYIVTDSTGAQIYRGASLSEADSLLRLRLCLQHTEAPDSVQ